MHKDNGVPIQLPWKFALFIKHSQEEIVDFRKTIETDKYRYRTRKDNQIREGKIQFTVIKNNTKCIENLDKKIIRDHEEVAFKRLYAKQEEMKQERISREEEKVLEFIIAEEKYYKKI
jgi:hypothetical protein